MAYEFLKKLFGQNEDGTDKALTYTELEALLDAEGGPKVVDLSAGGYVDKQKSDRLSEELKGVKGQLAEANKKIQEFKDMDIDGIKAAAEAYKTESEASIKALQDKLDAQDARHSAEKFLSQYEFSSSFAAEAVLDKFISQGFKKDENGHYLGADDYMKGLKESNPDAFKEEPAPAPEPPIFTGGGAPNPPGGSGKKMTLDEIMAYANSNPGTNIDALIDANITF